LNEPIINLVDKIIRELQVPKLKMLS